jgi:tetratricopeptide (TPR) repeat protein
MPSPRFPPRLITRPDAGARRWLDFRARKGAALPRPALPWLLLIALSLINSAGCGTSPPPPPQEAPRPQARPFAPEEEGFLVNPLLGYTKQVDPERQERIQSAHRALLLASDRQAALETADALLAEDPDFAPAQVLAAQVELGEGKYAEAVSRLLPIGDQMPQYVASQLALGRAAELAGDVPLAYSAFREIATRHPRAFQKLGELHPRALEIVSNRLQEAVRLQRLEDAEKQLSLLRGWAPSEAVTLEGARAIAVARGDRRAELAAVKELAAQRPEERALAERRAELELAVGDPSAGLQIIQGLADQEPNDPALADKLAAAKFRWRVSLLPKNVQDVAALPELTKGDLAVLLYWLIPSIRYGRPTAGRIATDVLDHPHQEEIVRVVNLGLMDVDSTLHRFLPGAPVRRSTALRSLVLVLSRFGNGLTCLEGASRGCEAAAACGLIAPDDCRASAPVAGGEAVELIRRTLKLLDGA